MKSGGAPIETPPNVSPVQLRDRQDRHHCADHAEAEADEKRVDAVRFVHDHASNSESHSSSAI